MAERTPRNKIVGSFVALEPRWIDSNVRSKSAADAPSDFTEAGPRAGEAVPTQTSGLVVKTDGVQTADKVLNVQTQRGGHPIPEVASFLWQESDDAADEHQGHDGYQALSAFEGLDHSTSGLGLLARASVIRLQSGELLSADSSNQTNHTIRVYDPKAGGWSTRDTLVLGPGSSDGAHALIQLPSGRVVFFFIDASYKQVHAHYSDDDGASWDEYSNTVLRQDADEGITEIAVSFSRGVMVMITGERVLSGGAPTGTLHAEQWISYDLGQSFDRVADEWNSSASIEPRLFSLVGTRSGKHVVAYLDEAGSDSYKVMPFAPGEAAHLTGSVISALTDLSNVNESAICMWEDEDRTIFVLLSQGNTTTERMHRLRRSTDEGATFGLFTSGLISMIHSGSERIVQLVAASTGGRTALLCRWDSSGSTTERSLACIWLGGHATHTFPTALPAGTTPPTQFSDRGYLGFCFEREVNPASQHFGIGWIPICLPDSAGWTLSTFGTPTAALASPGVLNIVSSGDRNYYTYADTNSQPTTAGLYFAAMLQVVSGGSLSVVSCGVKLRITDYDSQTPANNTWEHQIALRFTTTALRIYDTQAGAAVGGDISYDFTKHTWVAVAVKGKAGNTAELAVWIGDPLVPKRVLTLERTSTAINTSGGGNANATTIDWGAVDAGTSESNWSVVGAGARIREFAPRPVDNWVSGWGNPGDVRGRDWSTAPILVYDDVRVAVEGGPTKQGDKWVIATEYAHPISNIFPRSSPSPRQTWRSTADNVDQRIALDLEDDSIFTASRLLSHSIGLLILNANIRELRLEAQSGAGAWTTIGTFTPREDGLAFRRSGSIVRPDPGATDAASFFFMRAQHVGDTVDLGVGEGDDLHKIAVNRGGAWNTDGSGTPPQQLPELLLEPDNLVAGTPSSGSSADIWFRDWAAVLHEYDRTDHRLSLFIPAHKTADGYYEIGLAFFGDLLLLAHRFDRGYTVVREKNVDVFDRADGVRRTRKRGPQSRQFEFSFSSTAIHARNVQKATPAPDWISMQDGGGGLPVATPESTIRELEGMLEESDGADVPVAYLHKLPQLVAPTTTDVIGLRRHIVYGHLETAPLTETPWARRGPGSDEWERLQALLLVEQS